MTQKEKDLLLKDLCARLPYNPIVVNKNIDGGYPCELSPYGSKTGIFLDSLKIEDTKIFLRPMSSMTQKEIDEYNAELDKDMDIVMDGALDKDIYITSDGKRTFSKNFVAHFGNDWLNSHHFDYRGLIPKGLAIEITKENNPYKI